MKKPPKSIGLFPKNLKFDLKMKLSLLFFVTISFVMQANTSYSQKTKITLNKENVSLQEVIDEIETKTEFKFLFNTKDVDVSRKVSVKVKGVEINVILELLFNGTDTKFENDDRKIILTKNKEKKAVTVSSISPSNSQSKIIKGEVTDFKGQPLPGAIVTERGTKNSTTTDFDGSFSITVEDGNAMLEISYVGFTTKLIKASDVSAAKIILTESSQDLNEVVVVGYGVKKKTSVVGSISTLKGNEIIDVPSSNVTGALAGRLPGIIVTQRSGLPGADNSDISIRGWDKALIIVDGVQTDFSRLNPNDIESISVLKDASASIYGARAGNGVILVTTKRGKKSSAPKVEISHSYASQSSTVRPEYVNAPQYMELVNDYSPGTYSDNDFEGYKNGTKKSTDWYDATFNKNAPMTNTTASVSGGSDKVTYFLSYGYLNQGSVLKSGDINYVQNNLRSNIGVDISKSLKVGLDMAYRIEKREYPGFTMENLITNVGYSKPMLPSEFPDPSYPVYNGFQMGPNYLSKRSVTGYKDNDYRNTNVGFTLDYKAPFLKGLSAKAFVNYLTDGDKGKAWDKDLSYYNYDPFSETYTEVVMRDVSGIALRESYKSSNMTTSQFSVSYNNTFGKHKVEGLLLSEIIESDGDYFMAGRQDFISSGLDQMFASTAAKQYTDGWAWQDSRVSYVGRFGYTYNDKYIVDFTFREDASPRFIKDQRWGFFPAVSAGWVLSKESFINKSELFDNLKLRASYGQSGFDNIGNYNYLTGYQFGSAYVFDDKPTSGIVSKGLANVNATWETMSIYNAGLDFSMWNSRLFGNVDAFYRTRDGILAKRVESLPSTFGAELPSENLNSQTSRGFEIVLGHSNTIGNVKYTISGNVSYAEADWDHYDEPAFADEASRARYQKSGQPVNRYFGLQALGLFTSQAEIDNWADQDGDSGNGANKELKPGDIRYLDYNNDGKITDLDVHAIGKSNIPEIFYGLNAQVKYKGLDFSMLWQGATNYNVAFSAEAQQAFFNNATPLSMFMDRWTPENNDVNAHFPRTVSNSGSSNNYRPSTFWLQDGQYFRLKNITVGYTIPQTMTQQVGISSLRLYATGLNLLTFTDVYPYDPETGSEGRGWDFPQQRVMSLGVNLAF